MSEYAPGLSVAEFFDNVGGLNTSDSPFKVKSSQATGGVNYDYTQTGGIRSRFGHEKINASAFTATGTRGLGVRNTPSGAKSPIRVADRRIQYLDTATGTVTNLSEDTTAASTTPYRLNNTSQANTAGFISASGVGVLWIGGGESDIHGAYSDTKYTTNGVAAPGGTFTATVSATGGSFVTTGSYRYAVAIRKASTQALSNAYLSISATVANTTDKVTLDFTGLTGIDTTRHDLIYIYRSAVSGVDGFTTGDLVATVSSSTTSYVDTGTFTTTATNIPRPANLLLDNSRLDTTLTYGPITTWKRRLVVAANQTIYISDLNKPESWPISNSITVPNGGPITGLAVISFNTDFSNDEYLAIFQERQLWLLRGSSLSDWSLSFIDAVGCPNQAMVVTANGYLTWIDYRGIYLWDGSGKPIYLSRPIESLFGLDGDIAKPYLAAGCGAFFRKANQVIWYLPHLIYGNQKFAIKLDLRLTLPMISGSLGNRIIDGVFTLDSTKLPGMYAMSSYLPDNDKEEILLLGDQTGYVYNAYNVYNDGALAIDFEYQSAFMNMGTPNVAKRYHKVIVWVEELGTWNLTLDYWAGYKAASEDRSTITIPVSTADGSGNAVWDVALWDKSQWDDFTQKLVPLTFNLNSSQANNEGDCLRIKLRHSAADEPITIYGYSVLYSEKGLSK